MELNFPAKNVLTIHSAALSHHAGTRIEARRPGVAGTRGTRQVDGKNAEQGKASQHVEDNDAFFRLGREPGHSARRRLKTCPLLDSRGDLVRPER